jgi:hypothetical protein
MVITRMNGIKIGEVLVTREKPLPDPNIPPVKPAGN